MATERLFPFQLTHKITSRFKMRTLSIEPRRSLVQCVKLGNVRPQALCQHNALLRNRSIGWIIAGRLCIISGVEVVGKALYYYVTDAANKEQAEKEERRLRKETNRLKFENEKNHKEAMEAIALLNRRCWFIW
ncbi:hypothetical protein OROMI_015387 [Orobanche minor]